MKKIFSAAPILLMAVPFITAINYPLLHLSFIYDTGVMIYIIEFLSIHSSVALLSPTKTIDFKLRAFLLYGTASAIIIFTTQAKLLFVFFMLSLISKLIINKEAPDEQRVVKSFLLLFATTFFVIVFGGLLKELFPLPDTIYALSPANAGGLFKEIPQTLLIWGILYPAALFIFEFIHLPIGKTYDLTHKQIFK